jgi:uncharacterized membrane protein YhiD involved in acid resistance
MSEFLNLQSQLAQIDILTFILKLVVSTVCGTAIAFHVKSLGKIRAKNQALNFAKAQVLVCVAGCIMVVVIGDSVARAFGLFGLGSFIRFRTAVRNAVDTAVIFLLVGIGMAIGLGLFVQALIVIVFLYICLFFLGSIPRPPKPKKESADEEDGGE